MDTLTRRAVLSQGILGLAGLSLPQLLSQEVLGAKFTLDAKSPHFAPQAKAVIHLCMNGGVSHVDTFDPKPKLAEYAGKPVPTGNNRRNIGGVFPSPFTFKQYGESGIPVSELFDRTAAHVDEMAVIRSMHTDIPGHGQGMRMLTTGSSAQIRPSLGSWAAYGLGTENQSLPAFVALSPVSKPILADKLWSSGFLPAIYQGAFVNTAHRSVEKMIANLKSTLSDAETQRLQLDILAKLNKIHQETRKDDSDLDARNHSFELAYKMQTQASEAFNIDHEPQHVRDLYGPGNQAKQYLIARRLIERGVRFVQTFMGADGDWDAHDKIKENHTDRAAKCDQAIAGLLADLKQRGMLDEVLVVWAGEFGRTPGAQLTGTSTGREHNHRAFTVWMAGGGIKGGTIYGATDEFGAASVESRVHVHDLHATILHLLGFDHERLTFRHAGRDFRLTDVHGRVVKDILSRADAEQPAR